MEVGGAAADGPCLFRHFIVIHVYLRHEVADDRVHHAVLGEGVEIEPAVLDHAGDGVLHGELALIAGDRRCVGELVHGVFDDADVDLFDVVQADAFLLAQQLGCIDAGVGRDTARVVFDGDAPFDEVPNFAQFGVRTHVAGEVFCEHFVEFDMAADAVLRRGKAVFGELGRLDAVPGGEPAMQRLGHGAEIPHMARGHGGANAERHFHLLRCELEQSSGGGAGAHGADGAGGVPARAQRVQGLNGFADLGHDLEAECVGGQHVLAGRAQLFAEGDGGGHEGDRRMAHKRPGDVVVIERMGGGAVDHGGMVGRGFKAVTPDGGDFLAGALPGPVGGDLARRVLGAGQRDADAIEGGLARLVQGFSGNVLVFGVQREIDDLLCVGHGVPPPVFCVLVFRVLM